MRPYLPPRRAINFCSAGLGGGLFVAPLVMIFDILYLWFGDAWQSVFMPDGLPIGPVIFAVILSAFAVTFVRKIYVYKTIKWVRRFRRLAFISSLFTLLLLVWNVIELVLAPNQDVFSWYLMFVIALCIALGLCGLLLWTIHKYRWYHPDSKPEEWELPEAVLCQE
ncbi:MULTISPECIES: hypothetical protein [unclassified Acidocella]|nr:MULTISPECIES: hypothetical protein [unclassified Acidocella]WBO59810.1 hypothetical protein GT370_02625 [Acidocella sp. MX-AZ03]